MSETLTRLEPLEVLVPDQQSIVYPGSDGWLEVERGQSAPGANPAWVNLEICPDVPGTPAVPGKTLSVTTTPPLLSGTQWVFGATSLNPQGAGYALSTPDSPDWAFGTGDFTIEGRFYWNVVRKALFGQQNPADQTDRAWEWTMDVMPSGAPGFTFYCNDVSAGGIWDHQFDQAFTVTTGQWYHMAVVRSGNNLMFFVNGSQIGSSQTITANIRNSAQPLRILGDGRTSANDFSGYVDELRISKGIARWTSNFTPPSGAYTKDAYTVLLCHFEGVVGTTPTSDDTGTPAGPSTPFDPGSNPAWVEVER